MGSAGTGEHVRRHGKARRARRGRPGHPGHSGDANGVRFRADADGQLLTMELGAPDAAIGWRPVGATAWIGRDAVGAVCAVTTSGSTGAEALLRLIRTIEEHAPELRASLDQLLGGR
jgi:hypothetical protein